MGEAREVFDRVTEAVFGGDLEAAERLYSSDAIAVAPDGMELKGGHEIVGYLGAFVKAFPNARYEPLAKHEAGHVAIDEGLFIGTNTGTLEMPTGESIPATGKRVSIRGCDVAVVEHGKIVSHHFYFDQMAMLAQLGLLPGE